MFTDETKSSQRQQLTDSVAGLPQNNIEQVLLTLIQFTKARHKVLIRNLRNIDKADFSPQDLPSEEFAIILNFALDEHLSQQRLTFCDSKNIRFGLNGSLKVSAVEDNAAKALLQKNKDKYIQLQSGKLMENAINMKLAMVLLDKEPKRAFI